MDLTNQSTTEKDVKLEIVPEVKVTYKSFEELNEAFKQKYLK